MKDFALAGIIIVNTITTFLISQMWIKKPGDVWVKG